MGQLFYVWRVHILGRSWPITVVLVIVSKLLGVIRDPRLVCSSHHGIIQIAGIQLGFGLYSGITAGIAGHFSGRRSPYV